MAEHPYDDYLWYCSNKECENHGGQHTPDTEHPVWVSLGLDKDVSTNLPLKKPIC
jgi:hypothetical protein